MNERMYELIFESLQSKLDSGEITLEQAEEVNELAFAKYMCEDKSDIARAQAEELEDQSARSRHDRKDSSWKKRPKISDNMTETEKRGLKAYDHGKGRQSTRGYSADGTTQDMRDKKQSEEDNSKAIERIKNRQTAKRKLKSDKLNDEMTSLSDTKSAVLRQGVGNTYYGKGVHGEKAVIVH